MTSMFDVIETGNGVSLVEMRDILKSSDDNTLHGYAIWQVKRKKGKGKFPATRFVAHAHEQTYPNPETGKNIVRVRVYIQRQQQIDGEWVDKTERNKAHCEMKLTKTKGKYYIPGSVKWITRNYPRPFFTYKPPAYIPPKVDKFAGLDTFPFGQIPDGVSESFYNKMFPTEQLYDLSFEKHPPTARNIRAFMLGKRMYKGG